MRPQAILIRDLRYEIGGVETWVEALAAGLGEFDVSPLVLVPGTRGEEEELRGRLSGAEVVRVAASKDDEEQAEIILSKLSEIAEQGRRGIFLSGYYRYTNICALNLLQTMFPPMPVVHGRHESIYDWISAGPPRTIVVPSQDLVLETKRQIFRRSMRSLFATRVKFISHGIVLPDIVRRSPKDGTGIRLIAVCRLEDEAKRPSDYLSISRELQAANVPHQMLICGDGSARARLEVKSKGEGLGSVRFTGALNRVDVYKCLQASDVFLSTSDTEAFGLSLAEAMANGCVPVVTDIPGAHRAFVHSNGIRVPIGDIGRFCAAITQLSRRCADLRVLSLANVSIANQRLGARTMCKAYSQEIVRILGASPSLGRRSIRLTYRSTGDFAAMRAGQRRWRH